MILLMCPSESSSSSDSARDEPERESVLFKLKQLTGEVKHGVRGDGNIVGLPQILDCSRIHSGSEGLKTYLNEMNMGCMCILSMAITVGRMLIMWNMLLSHKFETWCSPTRGRNWFDSTCSLAHTRSSVSRDESRIENQTVTRTWGTAGNVQPARHELIPTQGRVGHVIATQPCARHA